MDSVLKGKYYFTFNKTQAKAFLFVSKKNGKNNCKNVLIFFNVKYLLDHNLMYPDVSRLYFIYVLATISHFIMIYNLAATVQYNYFFFLFF